MTGTLTELNKKDRLILLHLTIDSFDRSDDYLLDHVLINLSYINLCLNYWML